MEKKFNKYEYDRKYHAEHYYRMSIAIPKEMRADLEKAVTDSGMSRNSWLKEAIMEKLARQG